MKVTIVIPCYNAEEHILECLDSVCEQTYENIELIVINDGSTDRTQKLLKEWDQNRHFPTEIYDTENQGACMARNLGIKRAKGDYIQFLDADDLLHPDKIAHQVSLIQKELKNPDIIAAAYVTEIPGKPSKEKYPDSRGKWFGLLSSNLGITSANLFKKSSLLKVKGFDSTLKSSQEYDLMFRLMQDMSCDVLADPKILTVKREINPSAISSLNEEKNILRFIDLRLRIIDFLESERILSQDLLREWYQHSFTTIKRLYNYNKQESVRLCKQLIPSDFVPEISGAISFRYQKVYRKMGFRITQELYSLKEKIF